ncbi:hypothetical protein BH10BAC5_BH10BAC5_11550 [soil metagenome]
MIDFIYINKKLSLKDPHHFSEHGLNSTSLSKGSYTLSVTEKNNLGYGRLFTQNDDFVLVYGDLLPRLNSVTDNPGDLFVIKPEELIDKFKGNYVILRSIGGRINLWSNPLITKPVFYHVAENSTIYISSNLSWLHKNSGSHKIHPSSVIAIQAFDLIPGNRTLFDDIYILQGGEEITFVNGTPVSRKYYEISQLLRNKVMEESRSFDILSVILKENMKRFLHSVDKTSSALTGGFDGRLNFSTMTEAERKKVLFYSYGRKGSMQLSIPAEISRKLKVNYKGIPLDEDYEKDFAENSVEALKLSDGFAPFMRANYLYSHKIISKITTYLITGIFGSEVMRPWHDLGGIQMSDKVREIFMSDDRKKAFDDVFDRMENEGYILKEHYPEARKELFDYLNNKYFIPFADLLPQEQLYALFFTEGITKFFTQEIRVEKYYMTHFLPFIDLDFAEALLQSPFLGLRNGFYENSAIKRRRGQRFYAMLMNRFCPEIAKIKTDRGYAPRSLITTIGWLDIIKGFIVNKKIKKYFTPDDTFNAAKWQFLFYKGREKDVLEKDEIFGDNIKLKWESEAYLKDRYRFSRLVSIKYWYSKLI